MIAIKTMTDLPEHCWECPCHDGESGYCQADKEHRYSDYRPFWCPLVEVDTYNNWRRVNDGLEERKEDPKQAILGFTEFFKGMTGNQDLKIPDDIAKELASIQNEQNDD